MFQTATTAGFQNVWYWILSAVLWGQACHRILGVPHDMIRRSGREPELSTRVDELATMAAERMAGISAWLGAPIAALVGFGLAVLFVLGFFYKVEAAQAGFILGFPLGGVWLGTLRLALGLRRRCLRGTALRLALLRRRRWNLAIAIVALLAACMMGLAHHPEVLIR